MCATSQNITIQMRDVGVWGGGGNIRPSIVDEKEPLEEYKGEELGDFEEDKEKRKEEEEEEEEEHERKDGLVSRS